MWLSSEITKIGSKEEYQILEEKETFSDFKKIILNRNEFLMPGFVDCHTHAPQFPNIGLGLDRPLLEWLDKYTFPLESQYSKVEFASKVYKQVIKRLLTNGSTTACYFGSLHLQGTLALAHCAAEERQRALIGKVSMNIANDAGYYNDTATELKEVWTFVKKILELKNDLVMPIVTPRFAVSCDVELMKGLAAVSETYDCRIQSHISENLKEIEHVLEVNPDCNSYAEVYDKSQILNHKCIMAHAVHLTDNEITLLAARKVSIAHCPASNTRLRSGLCPVRKYLDNRITVGLGTDVSGGDNATVLDAMRRAMDVSSHLELLGNNGYALNWREVFYLATLGGAEALNLDHKIGNFKVGKEFDALLIDVYAPEGQIDQYDYLTSEAAEEHAITLIEKFIYVGDDRNIKQVYVKGVKVKDI